ncbi:MAG: MMPL family transporter [Dehalococcoidia bacterium]
MASPLSTGGLARAAARRPWLFIGVWIVILVAGIGIAGAGLSGVLTQEQKITSNPESVQAENALEASGIPGRDQMPAIEAVILRSDSLKATDAEFKAFAASLLDEIRALPDVASATSYFETNAPTMVSPDQHKVLLPVTLVGGVPEVEDHIDPLLQLVEERNGDSQFDVLTFGIGSVNEAFATTSERDLQTAEQRGVPVALIVLVLVFGAVVAAIIPIVLALVGIMVALGVTTLVGQIWSLSFFVQNMIIMIGLAVGIDYSLFIIERFREERRRGLDRVEAIAVAGNTASRAVVFSGFMVVIALIGMLLVPSNIFRALGAGAIIVVLVALAVTTTLLPAVLGVLGDGVNRLGVPFFSRKGQVDESRGFWAGAARVVMGHPWISAVSATALLVALSIPYFSISLGLSGAETLPRSTQVWEANDILAREFSQGLAQPTEIVVTAPDVNAPAVQSGLERLQSEMAADTKGVEGEPRFSNAQVTVGPNNDVALLSVAVAGDPASEESLGAIRDLRTSMIPSAFDGSGAQVYVGGLSAGNQDFFDVVDTYEPIVFGFVLLLSFILLTMVFRSIVVPLKAVVMNLLSVGATYGLLVLVFQEGVGADLLHFQQSPIIQAWIPLFLFSILFGLSMDYHVFLLSRIRERYDHTKDNAGSVAFGLRTTANIITGAALIMVVVFVGFAMGEMVMFQQMGFGLAVAVLLDATIVRTILVPSAMELLGDRNWYLPSWLHWLPDLRVEGPATVPSPQAAVAAGDE